jgi:tape measure domain-containing protein
MTVNAGSIQYQVEVDTAQVLTGSQNVNKSLDGLQTGMNKTDRAAANSSKSMNTLGKNMSTAGGEASKFGTALTPLAGAIAGIISIQAIANLQKLSEQFTLLESRVKRLSATAEDARTNYAALIQISSAGGSDLTTTIKLWESLTASLVSLGVTRDQVLSLTDTLQKIGKIGGSSAEEISAALRQFSQAVAGGTLRAEEFNSIIEQMPELGRKIAAGLGIPFGELRQQMLDGKLTIDRVLTAVYEQTGKVNEEFKKVPRSAGDAGNAIVNAMGVAISKLDQAIGASTTLAKALDAVANGIRLTSGQLSDQERINKLVLDRATAEQQYATQIKFGLKATAEATKARIDGMNAEIQAIQNRKVAELKAESDKLKITAPTNAPKTDSQKALDDLAKEAELTRLVGVERAKLAAKNKLGPGAKPEEIIAAQKLAEEIYNLEAARKQEGATSKKLETEAEQRAKKKTADERQGNEQNIKTLDALQEAIYQASLSTEELAARKAELSLNTYASPEDIETVRSLGVELEKLNILQAKRKEFGSPEEAKKKVTGTVDPLSGGEFDSQAARYQAEAEAEVQRYADQMTRLNEAKAAQIEVLGGYQTLEEQMAQQHADRMSQIDTARNTLLLNSAEQGFGGVADIMKSAFGEQSALYKVAFVAQKAAAIASATIAIQQGIALAAANPWPLNLAAMASVAAASASLVGNISSVAAPGRALGGPVQANEMYRVNETGAPEVFNAANGRQYALPNQRGEIVSAKDASAGASSGAGNAPVINNHNYSGQTMESTAKFSEQDRRWVIDTIVGDMMGDGRTSRATNQITGTRRQGT